VATEAAGVATEVGAAEEGAVGAVTADGASPFKKGSAVTKGTENICSGVNPAMLTPQSGFNTGHVRTNASAWWRSCCSASREGR
jgi:hypothetical protein